MSLPGMKLAIARVRRDIMQTRLFAALAVFVAATVTVADAARTVTIPAGTVLRVRLDQSVGSDISRLEERVGGTLVSPLIVDGRTVMPSGSAVSGIVTDATRSGKVKGRARIALRFNALDHYRIRTNTWARLAPATKKTDAAKIGIPAAGGAVVGALVGGKKGAAIGAAAGGGAGTAVVLTTRGKEVRLGRGAIVAVRLTEPLTLR
jgi:hypothetical protein